MYGTNEERQRAIKAKVESLRRSAAQIAKVRKTVESFNGKCYNCRLNKAIEELSTAEDRFYCSERFGWFYIYHHRTNDTNEATAILCAYSTKREEKNKTEQKYIVFDDNKRILSDAFNSILSETYAKLSKEAADLERSAEEIETTIKNLEMLRSKAAAILATVPEYTKTTYNLRKCYF